MVHLGECRLRHGLSHLSGRSFTLGSVGWINLVNAAYLVALGLAGIWVARRRMAGMLLT